MLFKKNASPTGIFFFFSFFVFSGFTCLVLIKINAYKAQLNWEKKGLKSLHV